MQAPRNHGKYQVTLSEHADQIVQVEGDHDAKQETDREQQERRGGNREGDAVAEHDDHDRGDGDEQQLEAVVADILRPEIILDMDRLDEVGRNLAGRHLGGKFGAYARPRKCAHDRGYDNIYEHLGQGNALDRVMPLVQGAPNIDLNKHADQAGRNQE